MHKRYINVILTWEMGQFVFAGIKDEHPKVGLIFFGLLRMHEFLLVIRRMHVCTRNPLVVADLKYTIYSKKPRCAFQCFCCVSTNNLQPAHDQSVFYFKTPFSTMPKN